MKVAVFSKAFPVLSETFIINQIIGLVELGGDVDIITNEAIKGSVMHSSIKENDLMSRVISLGLNSSYSKRKKIYIAILNLIKLVGLLKFKEIFSILFDRYLFLGQKLNLLSAVKQLGITPLEYDNVICHFGDNAYYVYKMRSLGLFSGKISVVFHGYEISRHAIVNKYIKQYEQVFKFCEYLLPISELWRRKLIGFGCDPLKIKVHRMGINIDDFNFFNINRKFSKPLSIIQVGRLTEKKAILNSIKAVIHARNEIDLIFTVIGDGELFSEAKELIYNNNAESFIKLLGSQPQSVVKEYLKGTDIFLLPSVRASDGDMEGIPVALMEAMASGLVVLSTYHSGIPELILDMESGFLVEEGDIKSIADCIVRISNLTDEQIAIIRKSARETCVEKYNNKLLNEEVYKLSLSV